MVNDSPLAGTEGKKVTSTLIRNRLIAEAETNVAITFSENQNKDSFEKFMQSIDTDNWIALYIFFEIERAC